MGKLSIKSIVCRKFRPYSSKNKVESRENIRTLKPFCNLFRCDISFTEIPGRMMDFEHSLAV